MESAVELILEESRWLAMAMGTSLVVVACLVTRGRVGSRAEPGGGDARTLILQAMNLFYGLMIGIMAAGHLLAVTIKLLQGSLGGSVWLLYPLGIGLAVPSWWLALRCGVFVRYELRWRRRLIGLNASLALLLLAFGLNNAPLALPALLNIAYQLHARRAVGWTIVTVSVVGNLGLFAGAIAFWASGQSFEQFRGL